MIATWFLELFRTEANTSLSHSLNRGILYAECFEIINPRFFLSHQLCQQMSCQRCCFYNSGRWDFIGMQIIGTIKLELQCKHLNYSNPRKENVFESRTCFFHLIVNCFATLYVTFILSRVPALVVTHLLCSRNKGPVTYSCSLKCVCYYSYFCHFVQHCGHIITVSSSSHVLCYWIKTK